MICFQTAFEIGREKRDLESDRFMNKLYDLQFKAMQQINDITNPMLAKIQVR